MKFIYLDCIGGASGDMLLASFIDGLVPADFLKGQLTKLNLTGYDFNISAVLKHYITAKKIDIVVQNDSSHRHLNDIVALINSSDLNDTIKKNAIAIFNLLGEQEAKIHNIPLEKIHFHEVGAIDSIMDIVGSCICFDYLNVQAIYSSELPVSYGTVKSAHGMLPVPAPATLAILHDYPLKKVNIIGELVTPTGAAIIKHFSKGLLPDNYSFIVEKIGYGAGSRDFEEVPNLLRTWLCKKNKGDSTSILQVEVNIDDMNPEIYPYIIGKLLDLGVNDVWHHNITMKHGRPASQLTILTEEKLLETVKSLLFSETTTIGFRYFTVKREILERKIIEIPSPWGKIKVKEIIWNTSRKITPEYKECKRISEENNIPLIEVYKKIENL